MRFPSIEDAPLAHLRDLFVPLPKGRLRQLVTPLGTIFRELSQSISVQHLIMTSSLFMFFVPFYLWFLSIFVHNLCYVVVFGVCLSIDYIHS